MSLIDDLVEGMIILAFVVFAANGFSVEKMFNKAAGAHKKGLSSYQAYSNKLTGYEPEKRK